MSYNSIHMQYPIAGGYRRSEVRPTTVAELSRLSWQKLRRPEVFLNGNTKWQEMPIVAFFFRNGFNNLATSKDIGYSVSANGNEGGYSLTFRLDRVNTQELLNFGIKLMMSGLLKRDWAWLLDTKRFTSVKPRNNGGCKKHSKQRITFSQAIVSQAIKKYGLHKVCFKLRVDMEVITFWRDYEI